MLKYSIERKGIDANNSCIGNSLIFIHIFNLNFWGELRKWKRDMGRNWLSVASKQMKSFFFFLSTKGKYDLVLKCEWLKGNPNITPREWRKIQLSPSQEIPEALPFPTNSCLKDIKFKEVIFFPIHFLLTQNGEEVYLLIESLSNSFVKLINQAYIWQVKVDKKILTELILMLYRKTHKQFIEFFTRR